MNEIKFQNDTYSIPESWNEMSTEQLELTAKIVIANSYPMTLLVRLALSFMGMRLSNRKPVYINGIQHYYIRHGWRRIYLVNSMQVYEISKCISFIIENNSIKSDLTRNPYPVIERRFYRLFGPADCFTNLTFGEFIQCEIERDLFNKTGNQTHINRMFAILWRPTCWRPPDGDKRSSLRMDQIDKRARIIAKLPLFKRRIMQWYYDGCLINLTSRFDSVFTSSGESTGNAFESFMTMVNMLAGNKLVDVSKIREQYLYDALFTLKNIIENHPIKH